jgi:putative tricarboxylic transport membrane protein
LGVILAGAAFAFGAGPAAAQGWVPTKPVEFVVPYAVGGGADVFARIMAQIMVEEKMVPVPVKVVNQPGGGSAVGVAYVLANRAREPHTLVLANNPRRQLRGASSCCQGHILAFAEARRNRGRYRAAPEAQLFR